MSLIAMDIPDEPNQLPGWLERHIAGLDLARLVAELGAIHGSGTERDGSVRELLGKRINEVIAHGLGSLSPEECRGLLLRPKLLLQLQQIVLSAESPYWDQLTQEDADLAVLAEAGERRLAELPIESPPVTRRPETMRRPWYSRPWAVSLANAAAVLLAVFLWRPEAFLPPNAVGPPDQVQKTPPGWGWDRAGVGGQAPNARAYLEALADAADEWSGHRPADAAELAGRLGEFRRGCTRLIFASHTSLSEDDRLWLVGRCRVWGKQLDELLEAVEAGRMVDAVRDQADATAHKIAEMLRERAKKIV